jgi:hypothetical protein
MILINLCPDPCYANGRIFELKKRKHKNFTNQAGKNWQEEGNELRSFYVLPTLRKRLSSVK